MKNIAIDAVESIALRMENGELRIFKRECRGATYAETIHSVPRSVPWNG
jgi:hypothetical protein